MLNGISTWTAKPEGRVQTGVAQPAVEDALEILIQAAVRPVR